MKITLEPVKNGKHPIEKHGLIYIESNNCAIYNRKCCICNRYIKQRKDYVIIQFDDSFCYIACKTHEDFLDGLFFQKAKEFQMELLEKFTEEKNGKNNYLIKMPKKYFQQKVKELK